MGINMDKMRARMEALQGNGNNKKNNFWKPQEGEQTIRLVAPSDGDPFRDYWFHYDVAGEPDSFRQSATLVRTVRLMIMYVPCGVKVLKSPSV